MGNEGNYKPIGRPITKDGPDDIVPASKVFPRDNQGGKMSRSKLNIVSEFNPARNRSADKPAR